MLKKQAADKPTRSPTKTAFKEMRVGGQPSFPANEKFFDSFPLETDFFFAILEWNLECTTGSTQMISGNTVSIQVWCPNIADIGFEELAKAKPDLPVFRVSDGTVSENLR